MHLTEMLMLKSQWKETCDTCNRGGEILREEKNPTRKHWKMPQYYFSFGTGAT